MKYPHTKYPTGNVKYAPGMMLGLGQVPYEYSGTGGPFYVGKMLSSKNL